MNLSSKDIEKKLLALEYKEDPSKAKRDIEYVSLKHQSKAKIDKDVGEIKSSLSAIIKNGYISKTLRTIQIGIKSRYEWLAEELLLGSDLHAPESSLPEFEYSAVATSKCTVYELRYHDLLKIPQRARDEMAQIAKTRKDLINERTLNLFHNLKSIQRTLDFQKPDSNKVENPRLKNQALG